MTNKNQTYTEDQEEAFLKEAEPLSVAVAGCDQDANEYIVVVLTPGDGEDMFNEQVRVQGSEHHIGQMLLEVSERISPEVRIELAMKIIRTTSRDQFVNKMMTMTGASSEEMAEELDVEESDINAAVRDEVMADILNEDEHDR